MSDACRMLMTNSEIIRDRELWKAQRRQAGDGTWRLTASEMAAVVGLAPPEQSSAYDLYDEKLTGVSSFAGNERTSFGNFAEPYVLGRFAEQHPELTLAEGGLCVSTTWPWLAATFDAIAHDGEHATEPIAPVQAKTWGSRSDYGPAGSAIMPDHLAVQLLIEMAVLGTSVAYEPVMFVPNDRVITFVLERDAQAERDIASLIQAGEEFIAMLDQEQPPEVDWSPATARALQRRFTGYEDRDVKIPYRLASRLVNAKAAKKAAERRIGLAQNQIRARLGNAARAVATDPYSGELTTVVTRSGGPRAGFTVDPIDWIETMRPGPWGKPPKQQKT